MQSSCDLETTLQRGGRFVYRAHACFRGAARATLQRDEIPARADLNFVPTLIRPPGGVPDTAIDAAFHPDRDARLSDRADDLRAHE
jgi:hypothetical protein